MPRATFLPLLFCLAISWAVGVRAATLEELRRLGPAAAPGGAPSGSWLPLVPQQPWTSPALLPHPSRCHLPAATAGGEVRSGEAGRQHAIRLRPTADRPELAWQLPPVPAPPWLAPSGPPAYAVSPDVGRAAAMAREVGPDAARPLPATDPTWDAAEKRTLATAAELRQKSAPFVRLAIPDPQESTTAIRLKQPLPDADPPAHSFELPPQPPMPVKK